MKHYTVNRHVLRISWLYLLLWVTAAAGIIILIAADSPYWFFPVPGFVFLFLWLMLAGLYPKAVVVSSEGMAVTMMGMDKINIINYADLQISDKGPYYELNNSRTLAGRKYLVTKKSIPRELEEIFQGRLVGK